MRQSVFRLLGVVLIFFLFSGCLPIETPPPTPLPPTSTATVTLQPSATIVWFPATATLTLFPTQAVTPTLDLLAGVGELVLEDLFTDPTAWDTSRTAAGSVAFGKQELTLAVAAEKTFLFSQRQSFQLSDFYLEIDVLPSLCLASDSYGLMLRASSSLDYYRLLINCNGQLRMERLKNGNVVLLQDWVSSGQIFPGGMLRSRLGVWALGDEIRIFVNGVYHFSVNDPVWGSGQVGVFARSAGDTPLTVSFSHLTIYSLDQGQPFPPTSTPRVLPSITPTFPITPTSSP